MERRKPIDRNNVVVVGTGPGGLAPFVAADRQGHLQHIVDHGIILIDSGSRDNLGQGKLNRYQYPSNSGATDLDPRLPEASLLHHAVETPAYQRLLAMGDNPANLATDIAPALGELGQAIGDLASKVHSKEIVQRIDQEGDIDDPTYWATTASGLEIPAKHLIQATGATERMLSFLPDLGPVTTSGEIFSEGDGYDEAKKVLQDGGTINVYGASHSGLGLTAKLRTDLREDFNGKVRIYHKGPLKEYYQTENEAREAGYSYAEDDVCPQSGKVNRFGGPRGDALAIARDVRDGREARVELIEVASFDELRGKANADLYVSAIGYDAAPIPVYRDGQEVGPKRDRGQVVFDPTTLQVVGGDGMILPNMYSVGLGSGIYPNGAIGEPSFRGNRIVSVNVMQGPDQGGIIAQRLAA